MLSKDGFKRLVKVNSKIDPEGNANVPRGDHATASLVSQEAENKIFDAMEAGEKIKKEVEEHLLFCEEGLASPRFKGVEPYIYLWKAGLITPYVTTIRIMYTGSRDTYYCADEKGNLFKHTEDGTSAETPEQVLSLEKHPDGWCPEQLTPRDRIEK